MQQNSNEQAAIQAKQNKNNQQFKKSFQTKEETEEILLQQLENLFDRPVLKLIQDSQKLQELQTPPQQNIQQPQQPQYKLVFEKDYQNTFLITNPQAIFKIFNKKSFLQLEEQSQILLLDKLEDILQKCHHNIHILTDHLQMQNVRKQNQSAINQLKSSQCSIDEEIKVQNKEEEVQIRLINNSSLISNEEQLIDGNNQEKDLLLFCIQTCFKLQMKNKLTAKRLFELIRRITLLKRFHRFHIEYIFQYLKYKCVSQCKKGKNLKAMSIIDSAIKIFQSMYEPKFEYGPTNYFYFSGFLTGIQVNTKNNPSWPFVKGFAAAIWFQMAENSLQDNNNLPVLFNCFSQGFGGFECYFNGPKLFYRILQRNYTLPTIESNGVLIGEKNFEFEQKKWYFLGIEHDKPILARAQLSAFINEKHVVKFLPVDYPKFDKNAKLNMITIAKNFVGSMSTFILFKEQINNTKKFSQMYQQYEQGIYSNAQIKQLNPDIFDQKIIQKFFLFYCAERAYNKIIYDCVDLNDGDLMINSGKHHCGPKAKLFHSGGLNSLLPILEYIQVVSTSSETFQYKLDYTVNEYLKLINSIISSKAYSNHEAENSQFFKILFHLLSQFNSSAVNNQTIQLLAEIRFSLVDAVLQEQFFSSLLYSSDYWLSTNNVEVINEFWSFIKAIYSQNPVQYNKIFSIQNLIDLMIKISDIKEGHCCEYHKTTSSMIYQSGYLSIENQAKDNLLASNSFQRSSYLQTQDKDKQTQSKNPFYTNVGLNSVRGQQKVYNIDKYLTPITGVLEGVLTSGGNEIVDQIQHVAKSLTIKSSPCFHLHMLKLLKVLLLDSKEDQHCASPIEFAAQFLNAKGLQILLYLCQNSSFDVKSMCIKLIDVLSSHTSLIKMRIDTDLITYMCNIILPKQIVESMCIIQQKSKNNTLHSRLLSGNNDLEATTTPLSAANQYQMIEQEEYKMSQEEVGILNESDQLNQNQDNIMRQINEQDGNQLVKQIINNKLTGKNSIDNDKQLNKVISQQQNKIEDSKINKINFQKNINEQFQQEQIKQQQKKKPLKFGSGLFMDNESDQEEQNDQNMEQDNDIDQDLILKDELESDMVAEIIENKRLKGNNQKMLAKGFGKQDKVTQKVQQKEELQIQPAQSISRGGKKVKLSFGFDEEESEQQETIKNNEDKTEIEYSNQSNKQKMNSTSKQAFDIGSIIESEKLTQINEDDDDMLIDNFVDKKKFMNTQKIPLKKEGNQTSKGMGNFKMKGLELNLPEEKPLNLVGKNKQQFGQNKEKQQIFQQNEDNEEENLNIQKDSEEEEKNQKGQLKYQKQVKSEFANENVMSKSNLRKPKSFNFGFSEEGQNDESENEETAQTQKVEKIDKPKPKIGQKAKNKKTQKQLQQIDEQQETTNTNKVLNKKQNLFEQEECKKSEEDIQPQVKQKPTILLMQKGFQSQHQRNKSQIKPVFQDDLNIDDQPLQIDQQSQSLSKDEPEKVISTNQQLIGGTTGATNETNFDSSYSSEKQAKKAMISFQKKSKLFTNQNNMLNIDTEEINKLYTYGGEKGEVIISATEEEINFLKEIDELADMCIAAMKRKSPNDPIEYGDSKNKKPTFEQKFLIDNNQQTNNQNKSSQQQLQNPRKQFMTPQSVRGIKKIEFQMNQQENEKKQKRNEEGNKTGTFSNLTIVEEQSPIGTSKSSSSTHKKFTESNLEGLEQCDTQQYIQGFEQTMGNNDDYTLELENLYTSCLEWILNRAPSSLYQNIVVDDFDKVCFTPALSLMMTLVTYSNNLLRQKALQDLHMLARWDSYNGTRILFHPQFHTWLLDLLMPYQDLSNSYLNLSGPSLAVYDIGCKLHTLLLKNSCMNPEDEAYKRLNYVARWPQIVCNQQFTEYNKIKNQREIETANKLSRILLTSLLNNLKDEASKVKPIINEQNPTWKNIVYITFLVEEIMLTSSLKDFKNEQTNNNQSNEPGRDVNSSILKWIQKDFLLYMNGSNDKNLWAEWDIIEALFQTLDSLFNDRFFKRGKDKVSGNQTIEENVFSLLEKSSADDFSQDVDILMYEGKQQNNQTLSSQTQQNEEKSLQNIEKGGKKPKKSILSFAAQALNLTQQSTQTQTNQNQIIQSTESQCFMSTVLNMLCIALIQADTKQLVQTWLDRLERYIKFIMIVSETWKSRHINNYNTVQKKFTDIITFALTFLFHEIHYSANTRKQQQFAQFQNQTGTQTINTSPKEQQVYGKIFAQSLKNLMIYFINIIEYSKIRYTPQQLESSVHLTACRGIFNNILVKSYSQGQTENLISIKDISRYKTSDYDDFPECFYLEDWKVAFFSNELMKQIVKRQINYKTIESYILKKQSYATHCLELNERTEKTKDEILKRMQNETLDVISGLSESEFERKNRVSLLNENQWREQKYYWKQCKKSQLGCKGIWSDLTSKYQTNVQMKTNDGYKGFMQDRLTNGFKYIKEGILESKIFKYYDKKDINLSQNDNKDTSQQIKNKESQKKNKQIKIQKSADKKQKIIGISNETEEEEEDSEEEVDENENENESLQEVQYANNFQQYSPQNDTIGQNIHFFNKSLVEREKLALKKSYTFVLKEQLMSSKQKCKEILSDLKCAILKPFYQRTGSITLTNQDIIFFDDLYTSQKNNQEVENIFFFNYEKKHDQLLYKIIPLQNIKEQQRRRFIGRKTAIELFMMDNTSLLLNFTNIEDRDLFAKKVVRQRSQKCQNLKYYDTLEPRRILKKRELTEKWLQWKISNFEYLMNLNNLAGRSYNDLSQYPVFPWIFVDYTTENPPDLQATNSVFGGAAPQSYRDLNKNIQLLGSAERQAILKVRFEDPDNDTQRFHCGSTYSNPGIVLHYLCRLSPYIDAYVELHNKQLDKSDRTFYSIQSSINNALIDQSDVREIIPEFFYCPEMFMNSNNIKFGIRDTDQCEVNNILLPNWCQGNPYQFVMVMREAFESPYVSMNIGGWIDYIFGCKQREQEAERCLNTFSTLAYEDGIDLDQVQDENIRKSNQCQMYHFGQIPSQLFMKNQKHPNKLPRNTVFKFNFVVDNIAKIKVYKPVGQQQAIQQKNSGSSDSQQQLIQQQTSITKINNLLLCNEAILKARFFDDQTIVGASKDGTITYFIWLSRAHELNPTTPFTCCEDRKKKYDSKTKIGGLDMYDRSVKKFDFPMHILMNGRYIVKGGFWDGKLIACPFESNQNQEILQFNIHQSTITVIAATSNDRFLITGSKMGDIVVWNNNFGGNQNITNVPKDKNQSQVQNVNDQLLSVEKHICEHESQISSIFINEDMNLFLTSSYDGTSNLYNLWTCKIIRSFSHPNLAAIHSGIIIQNPLPGVALYSREDHMWHSFSINGQFLDKQREECSHIVSPLVVKDSYFMDKLIYGTERGYIVMRSLPNLKILKKLQVSNNYPVLSLMISNEKKFLLVGCGDGGLNVITEPSGSISGTSSVVQGSQSTLNKLGGQQNNN